MTECINTEVREALPDLLNGRLSVLDTATMNAHIEACAECRAELELLREIRGSRIVPRMDAARIASAIAPYGGATARWSLGHLTPWRFANRRGGGIRRRWWMGSFDELVLAGFESCRREAGCRGCAGCGNVRCE